MESMEKQVNILLVENDPGDQKLIKTAVLSQNARVNIEIVSSGEAALDYLRSGMKDSWQYPRPGLILLDLNMPGIGGKGFLKVIKADDDLCSIPVVIVTTSDSEVDIEECYAMHAAGYVQKSAAPREFSEILEKLARYWLANAAMLSS
jgi:CheY-like chemotaxis protein